MYRFVLLAFVCCSTPATACEDPLDAIAKGWVQLTDKAAHAVAFDDCYNAFVAQLPADRHDQIPKFVDEILLFAARYGDEVVVKRMLQEKSRLGSSETGVLDRALSDVATLGHTEVTRLLLEAGADPNDPEAPVSPLFVALHSKHADTARLLFEAGGEIRRPPSTPDGTTLIEEVIYGRGEVADTIALLIEWGHDPSEPMSLGNLPIHTAAVLGQGDVIRALVAGGAEVEALDRQGQTPLEAAAGSFGGLPALPALLELKATAVDAAYYRANLSGSDMNVAYLEAIGDDAAQQRILDQALITFLQRGRGSDIDDLLRAGANPNAFQGQEHPLHLAHCFPPVGNTLLDFGADPDLAWPDGRVPDWAAECAAFSRDAHRYMRRLGFVP